MKVGLALSGGGVLGAAHLGALREIEKQKIKINLVSGTSSGAILGALFCAGGTDSIENFLTDLATAGLIGQRGVFPILPDTIFKKVREILTKYLPKYFYDLPVPFIAVATNFSNGEPIYLENGNLVDAIMASAAYPGVFPTQEINGKSLIDGGMTRNLPAGILQKRGIEFVIGSSLYRIKNLPEYDLPNINPNRFSSFLRAMDIIQMELAHYEEKRCDFCFTPPVESFAWYNFDRFEEIRKVGIDYAIEIRSELEKALKSPKKKSPFWRKIFS